MEQEIFLLLSQELNAFPVQSHKNYVRVSLAQFLKSILILFFHLRLDLPINWTRESNKNVARF
jgi:hypothetical protein